MKIKTKLSASFLAISLPILILTNIFFYSSEKKILTNQILNHLESVASIQHNRIESIILQNLERLSLVLSRTQLRISLGKFTAENDPKHLKKITRILDDAHASSHDFSKISLLNIDGTVIASTDEISER